MNSNDYAVDVVICIDGTRSMDGMINKVKEEAKNFYLHFYKAMQYRYKQIKDNHYRVKVIVFRDFADASAAPLEVSPFYNLIVPSETDEFYRFIDSIELSGSINAPVNALEAIYTAIKSEWEPKGGRFRKQIILVFTNSCTYNLKNAESVSSPDYPDDMPNNLEELMYIWENGNQEYAPVFTPKCAKMAIVAPFNTDRGGNSGNGRVIEWSAFLPWERVYCLEVDNSGDYKQVDFEYTLISIAGPL